MRPNLPEDIWKKIDKKGTRDCWFYTGGTFSGRYGRFSIKGASKLAHRVVYELVVGEIPPDQYVMHKCNNKLCCNPSHLTIGSNSENQRHASSSGAWPVGASGIRGVSFVKKRGYWRAQGYLGGKVSNLYTGPSKEKAITARNNWERETGINFKL